MSWRNNVCNQQPHNCRKGDRCNDTEECCFERDTPSGQKGNQGTCVAKGSCDFRTGFPTNTAKIPCSSQNYSEGYSENNDNGRCTDWKWGVLILSIVSVFLLIAVVYLGIKCRK